MSNLRALLKHPNLWRARQLVTNRIRDGHPTGFSALDDMLCDNGWPAGGLSELLCDTYGVGELRLLAPALARLSTDQARWIAWVNPPFVPYAPALTRAGIDIDKVLLIHPKNHREALWALEQTLKTGTSSAALAWLDESKLKITDIRRLQLAAKQGRTWANLFRPSTAADKPSMAELRIMIDSVPTSSCDRLALTVLKRRGGWPTSSITLELGQTPVRHERKTLQEQLSLWRNSRNSCDSRMDLECDTPSQLSQLDRNRERSHSRDGYVHLSQSTNVRM